MLFFFFVFYIIQFSRFSRHESERESNLHEKFKSQMKTHSKLNEYKYSV